MIKRSSAPELLTGEPAVNRHRVPIESTGPRKSRVEGSGSTPGIASNGTKQSSDMKGRARDHRKAC